MRPSSMTVRRKALRGGHRRSVALTSVAGLALLVTSCGAATAGGSSPGSSPPQSSHHTTSEKPGGNAGDRVSPRPAFCVGSGPIPAAKLMQGVSLADCHIIGRVVVAASGLKTSVPKRGVTVGVNGDGPHGSTHLDVTTSKEGVVTASVHVIREPNSDRTSSP